MDKDFKQRMEKLLDVTKHQLKIEGYNDHDAEAVIGYASLILLDFIICNAPVKDSNFQKGLEISLTFLKAIQHECNN